MSGTQTILYFISGISIFLFGIFQLTATVRNLLTRKVRDYIRYSVETPFYGFMVGIIFTILLQSSTATTVISIGMVSAGLISFYNSLGVILGADIGTTLTVQLVVWKVTTVSPVFILLGAIMWIGGKEHWKQAGQAVFYFGLMFFGLALAADSIGHLVKSPELLNRYFHWTKNPALGFLIGIGIAAAVASSAIPISILAVLAQKDLMGIEAALPILLGANVGTTFTALLASTASNISGKRSAVSHAVFKICGVAVFFLLLPAVKQGLENISSSPAQQIALGHFILNIFIAAAFIFVLTPFSRVMEKILPGEENVLSLWPEYLNAELLSRPEKAIVCVREEIRREATLARRMVTEVIPMLTDVRKGKRRDLLYIEIVVDSLRTSIVHFLWEMSCTRLSAGVSKKLFLYTAMADDIERIGDHCMNLSEFAEQKHRRNIAFSEHAQGELAHITKMVADNVRDAVKLIEIRDQSLIDAIRSREERIDNAVRDAREKHLERFYTRVCQAEAGPIFIEMLINLERISDHCENIAGYFDDLPEMIVL